MVEIITTKDVKHRVNNDYPWVLIQFRKEDSHFHERKMNWLPKHHEIRDYLTAVIRAEPNHKKDLLAEYFIRAILEGYNQLNQSQEVKEHENLKT